jgi:L-phenylalanine/L-methionine N-acetyltransferase
MPPPPDGLILRPVSMADVAQLHELLTLPGTTWGTNQITSQTIEQVRSRLEGSIDNPNSHELVAELQGKVVGSASLHVRNRKQRFTGSIGITVHDDYVNRGIGRTLMEALLDLADNVLGLKRVELDVITDNAAAIHLYESLGFEREGIRRAALFRGGVFVDLLMMGRVR